MNEIQTDVLQIVADVRMHLEFQKALGVSVVEISGHKNIQQQQAAGKENIIGAHVSIKDTPKSITPKPDVRVVETAPVNSPSEISLVSAETSKCNRCKLSAGRKNIVFGEGNPDASIVFIGEGPGQEEDDQGKPFAGEAGRLLTDIIVKGMKLKPGDVYLCTVVKCRLPENREPEQEEIEACEPFLIKQVQAIKPKVIIALGATAVKTLVKTKEEITTLRGKWQTCLGIKLMPTFHPAHLLKIPADKKLVWEDIKLVLAELERIRKG